MILGMESAKIKVVLYDFDGTIADTLEEGVRIYNEIAEENNYGKMLPEQFSALRKMGIRELAVELKVPFIKVPWVIAGIRTRLKARIPEIGVHPGMMEAIGNVGAAGYRQGVVTSNSKENVALFLQKHKLPLEFAISEKSLLGKGRVIGNILKKEKLSPNEVIYIGDEVRDVDAAKENEMRIISVTWGANSKEALMAKGPDSVIDDPSELLRAISNL